MLDLLVEHAEPMTVAQVAETLGQHPNTVREHLEVLARTGLAVRDQRPPVGRGRPASVYTYAPEASFSSPEYAVLAGVIVSYLSHVLPDGALLRHHAREAGRAWGRAILEREQAAHAEPAPRGTAGAVEHLRRLLERTGFEPEAERDGDMRTLRLYRCPVLELARDRPELVCGAHLGMAREILAAGDVPADQVTLEAFTEPGACLLHVAARAAGGANGTVAAGPRAPADSAAAAAGAEARADGASGRARPALAEDGLVVGPHRRVLG